MPRFDQRRPAERTRLLYLGHTGAGKTGSLCSLAAAGYTVRILDLDNQVALIDDFVTNKQRSIYCKAKPGLWTEQQAATVADRISYVTITEGYRLIGPKAVSRGDSWAKIQGQLNRWKDGDDDFGNIATWGGDCVLVIDGLSRLCESAMNFQLAMNGRSATGPQVGDSSSNDYSAAYRMIQDFLDLLKCDDIKCNIILIAHIAFLDTPESVSTGGNQRSRNRETQGFPQTVGRLMSPKIGQYFNSTLQAKTVGAQHLILTTTADHVELKTVAPLRVKPTYPLETGLAEYFRDIRAVSYADAAAEPDPALEAAK